MVGHMHWVGHSLVELVGKRNGHNYPSSRWETKEMGREIIKCTGFEGKGFNSVQSCSVQFNNREGGFNSTRLKGFNLWFAKGLFLNPKPLL